MTFFSPDSQAPFAADSAQLLERRLRAALAGTSEQPPRPIWPQGVAPHQAAQLLTPQALEKLRPAAVLAPIVRRPQGLTVLLTRRADHMRTHQGQVAFPGGRRDASDDSAKDNALREAEEEVGLARRHVEVIGYLDDYPTNSDFLVTPVVGLVDDEAAFKPDPEEVAEVFELPLALLLDPRSYQRQTFLRDGVELEYMEVLFEGRRVWGATAGMLWDLCRKVDALLR